MVVLKDHTLSLNSIPDFSVIENHMPLSLLWPAGLADMNSAGAEEQINQLAELAGKFNSQFSEDSQVEYAHFSVMQIRYSIPRLFNIISRLFLCTPHPVDLDQLFNKDFVFSSVGTYTS
jgi:hypothetical protein